MTTQAHTTTHWVRFPSTSTLDMAFHAVQLRTARWISRASTRIWIHGTSVRQTLVINVTRRSGSTTWSNPVTVRVRVFAGSLGVIAFPSAVVRTIVSSGEVVRAIITFPSDVVWVIVSPRNVVGAIVAPSVILRTIVSWTDVVRAIITFPCAVMGVVTFPRVAMDKWSKGKNYCTKEVEVDGMHPVWRCVLASHDFVIINRSHLCQHLSWFTSHFTSFHSKIIITLLHPVGTAANYKCEACYEKYASLRAGLPNLP